MPALGAFVPRLLKRSPSFAALACTLATACDPAPPPIALTRGLEPPAVTSAIAPSSASAPLLYDACAFDWVDLDEAFRVCPIIGPSEETPAITRRVRSAPAKLVVASGATLSFAVGIGREGGRGGWTVELDDRCGVAMRPLLVDGQQRLLDDVSVLAPPACPATRARVRLSGRGEVTTRVSIKAVKRTVERVVVGHKTLPGGRVEDVVEMRTKETPLPPGNYGVELMLPTPDGAAEVLPLEVTAARVAPPAASAPRPPP